MSNAILLVYGIYFSIIASGLISSLINRKFLHPADKYLHYLLLCNIVVELSAIYFMKVYKNNMYVYNIFSPIELFLIALYFQERIDWLKKRKIGIYIGCVGIIFAICNSIFWQPINTINSIFLLFEGFVIIGLCVFSYYQLMLHRQPIISNVHFWFTTIFLFYWSCLFSYWGMYDMLLTELNSYMNPATYILWIVNIVSYLGLATIFLFYKKIATIRE